MNTGSSHKQGRNQAGLGGGSSHPSLNKMTCAICVNPLSFFKEGRGREGQFNRSTFEKLQLFKISKILSEKSIFSEKYHEYSIKIVSPDPTGGASKAPPDSLVGSARVLHTLPWLVRYVYSTHGALRHVFGASCLVRSASHLRYMHNIFKKSEPFQPFFFFRHWS